MARRASAIESFRNKAQPSGSGLVIVDVGDALLANPLHPPTKGDLLKAETILRAQGLMGIDGLAPGEAEIAVGSKRLLKLARQTSQTLLCANVRSLSGRKLFEERKLLETGGVKVGLFALLELKTTEKKALQILRKAGLRVRDPVQAARIQVKALQKEGAELIVALAHVGLDRAKVLAREVEGIQLMVVAHSGHQLAVPLREKNTYLVEGGRRGQKLGHVQFRLGEGWSATETLTDDSHRHLLYAEAQRELKQIEKGRTRGRNSRISRPRRLERVRSLARQLETLSPPPGRHTIVARLVTLDDAYKDHPGVAGLIAASRDSWKGAAPGGVNRVKVRIPARRIE